MQELSFLKMIYALNVILLYTFFLKLIYFLFCSSSHKNTSNDAVMTSNDTSVGAETTVYIDKIITVQEVTTVDFERVTGEIEVLFL